MSTILKALRRLEQDKKLRVQRPLREEVASGAEPRRRFPVLLTATGVFGVGIALGAAALFLWPASVPKIPDEVEPSGPAVRRVTPSQPATASERPPTDAPTTLPGAAAASEVAVVRPIEPPPLMVNEGDAAAPPRPPRPGEIRPGAEALKPSQRKRSAGGALGESSSPSQRKRSAEGALGESSSPSAHPSSAHPSSSQRKRSAQPAKRPSSSESPPPTPEPAVAEPVRVAGRPAAPPASEPKPSAEAAPVEPTTASQPKPSAEGAAVESSSRSANPSSSQRKRSTEGALGESSSPSAHPSSSQPSSSPPPTPATRSAVPVILVSRTQWHPRPERREALIEVGEDDAAEKRRVREGDSVGPLVVQTIEPSGVVFQYEGTALRHAVGSDR